MTGLRSLAGGTGWLRPVTAICAIFIAGCSGGGSPSAESAQEVSTAATTRAPATTAAVIVPTIDVRLVIDGKPHNDTIDVGKAKGADPFGKFASCSGLRTSFGAYQMLVSGSEALGGAVQVNATSNPHDAGPVPASARLESELATVDIDGTLDLADDYRSGRFLGTTAGGSRVVIEFDCESPNAPAPLDRTRPYIDVALLMVKGNQRRVLSLGLIEPCGNGGVKGKVPADEGSAGGLSEVDIAPDSLSLFVGGTALELAQSSVAATSATTGTFAATTADGATITGAYSCRP